MNSKELGTTIIIVALIGILILLAVDTQVTAQEGGEEVIGHGEVLENEETRAVVTVPGGPGFVSIHPRAFQPGTQDTEWAYFEHNLLYNPGTVLGHYYAEVSLPHNATITKLVVYYYDACEDNITARLIRQPLSGGGLESMASAFTEGSNYWEYRITVDETIDVPIINLQDYGYFVVVDIPEGCGDAYENPLALTGVRIDYGYTDFLPSVMK